MSGRSLAHARWDCACRIVWIPKYRRKVLYRERRAGVGSIIREPAGKKTGCEVVEGSVCSDHARVCLRIPPKCAVPDVTGRLEGKSALALCDRHPEWGSGIGRDGTFWARGRYASTVGPSGATARKRMAGQEEGGRFER